MKPALLHIETLYNEESYSDALVAAQELLQNKAHQLSFITHGRLYRIVGLCAKKILKPEVALHMLKRAHYHDPLNEEVLTEYGLLAIEHNEEKENGWIALELLLLHHVHRLSGEEHQKVLQILGEQYVHYKQLKRGISKLTYAWELSKEVKTGLLLLKAFELRREVLKARLLRSTLIEMVDGAKKAKLLLKQAEVFASLNKIALSATCLLNAYQAYKKEEIYDQALVFFEANQCWKQLADLMEIRLQNISSEDFVLASEALITIYQDRLQLPLKAAQQLEKILDREPKELPRFERLARLYHSNQAWHQLHDSYARMIQRVQETQPENRQLLALLWKSLGDLCNTQLKDKSSALYAFKRANEQVFAPEFLKRIIFITSEIGSLQEQLEVLAHGLDRMPERLDIAEQYGTALLRANHVDRGYVVLRTVVALGSGSQQVKQIVARYRQVKTSFSNKILTPELRAKFICGPQTPLDVAFEIAHYLLAELYEQNLETRKLASKDKIPPEQPLIFNQVLKQIAPFLGFDPIPDVWETEHFSAIQDTVFQKPALLVAKNIQSGFNKEKLAFGIGQRLAMMQPRYAFAGQMLPEQLKTILACLINTIRPDFPITNSTEIARIKRTIQQKLTPQLRQHLSNVIEKMYQKEAFSNVDQWLDLVTTQANKIGFLCADSPFDTFTAMNTFAATNQNQNIKLQQKNLFRWAWSKEYAFLRKELGLSIRI